MTEENFIGRVAGQRRSVIAWIRVNDVGLADRIRLAQPRARQALRIFGDDATRAGGANEAFTRLFALAGAAAVMIRLEAVLADGGANVLITLVGTVDASCSGSDQKVVDVVATDRLGGSNGSLDFVAVLGVDAPTNQAVAGALTRSEQSTLIVALWNISAALTLADRQDLRLELRLMTQRRVFRLLTRSTAHRRTATFLHLRAFQVVRTRTAAHYTSVGRRDDFVFARACTRLLVLQRRWAADAVVVAGLNDASINRRAERFARVVAAQERPRGANDGQR